MIDPQQKPLYIYTPPYSGALRQRCIRIIKTKLLNGLWSLMPMRLYPFLVNLVNGLAGKNHSVRYHREENCFYCYEGDVGIYYGSKYQYEIYSEGPVRRLRNLVGKHFLDEIAFSEGDIFIDCGANIGEYGVWAKSTRLRYLAFEPDINISRLCDLNAYDGQSKTINKALWKEDGIVEFFRNSDRKDSSIIEFPSYVDSLKMPAITLDSFCLEHGIEAIRFLKLEAEGAEPEVLMGAVKMLAKTDYISVDCGPERGLEQSPTVIETHNILIDRGFILLGANLNDILFLYGRAESF